jgi:hypothetical protein
MVNRKMLEVVGSDCQIYMDRLLKRGNYKCRKNSVKEMAIYQN